MNTRRRPLSSRALSWWQGYQAPFTHGDRVPYPVYCLALCMMRQYGMPSPAESLSETLCDHWTVLQDELEDAWQTK